MSGKLFGALASAVTLIEASGKWCHRTQDGSKCIGDRCMAWRWVGWRSPAGDVWHFAHKVPKSIHADPTGVCGLAGAP